MNVVMGADHNGVGLKAEVKKWVRELGHMVVDIGTYDPLVSVDYTDYAHQVAQVVAAGDADRGVLICGTGQGMCMAANKTAGVRASLVHNLATAPLTREHNDANVLCLGAWIADWPTHRQIVEAWFTTAYGEARHERRMVKLDRSRARRVVLANGVFDILHAGHIELLNFARRLGDKLVVAINSDEAVSRLKGPGRPVIPAADRKRLLQSLRAVDEVIVFDATDTGELLDAIRPDTVVKGGEWTAEEVRRRDNIPEHIGVVVCPLKSGYSSTAVIKSIKEGRG